MRVWAVVERPPMCLLSTLTTDAGGGGEGAGRPATDTGRDRTVPLPAGDADPEILIGHGGTIYLKGILRRKLNRQQEMYVFRMCPSVAQTWKLDSSNTKPGHSMTNQGYGASLSSWASMNWVIALSTTPLLIIVSSCSLGKSSRGALHRPIVGNERSPR